jgi:hypothetical protein
MTMCRDALLCSKRLLLFMTAWCLGVILAAPPALSQVIEPRPAEELRKLPIALGDGEVVKLLQKWWREGTAAGNVGDWYDNRDGEHSPLDLAPWPQLQKVRYTQAMINANVHKGGQTKVLPVVVFGNSSTSAPATQGGSNPRQYYTSPIGLNILDQLYAKNNLYIYPEHHDHDPGRNASGPGDDEGYGDLFPTNTPYLIISQGSSFSDQPFMRALPYVLAAFRPDVKAKLADNGMLMPAVQMIFRASNKHLKDGEYLTAKAHPSVFEGAWVDPLKMVNMAHGITLYALPPAVRLKVVDEDRPKAGIDFFDPTNGEALGDTSAVIARVFRGKELSRKMTVSAEASRDLNGKPLKFEWKLFRGDPRGVKITPKNAAGSVVDIEVAHPKRRPIAPGAALQSSRVDIGVFVHNGSHWSAPGFITWYGLEHENRAYDDKGRIAEMAYGSGEIRIAVKDWWKFLSKANAPWFPPLTKDQAALVAALEKERGQFLAGLAPKEKSPKDVETAVRDFDNKQQAKFISAFAASHLVRVLQLAQSNLVDNADYKAREKLAPEAAKTVVQNMANQMRAFEIKVDAGAIDRPLFKGPTGFDRELAEWLNAERLNQIVFPDTLQVRRMVNFVDVRLSLPRIWRDVYLYESGGQCVGWMRLQTGQKEAAYFTADGLFVAERDELGRCRKAAKVSYSFETKAGAANRFQLRWQPTADVVEYEYRGPDDRRGKIKTSP